MLAYRLLTGDDSSAFCHKVSKALYDGWSLYGNPSLAIDPKTGESRTAQAIVKEVRVDYSTDLKLGEL